MTDQQLASIRERVNSAAIGPDGRPMLCEVFTDSDGCRSIGVTDEFPVTLAEVSDLLDEVELCRPAPCVMKQGEPYDFGWCETHDTTFPLGGTCKFDGRELWAVYAEEADEQRRLRVKAEAERDWLACAIETGGQ